MDAHTHYISLLRLPDPRRKQGFKDNESIRKGLLDWLLFRRYWETDDSLERLASELDVIKEDISEYLVLHTGAKFRTIKKELRMSDAKQMLLDHPEMSIYQVSKCVGIIDKSNFRKMFKEEVGFSPSIWKKGKGNPCLCRAILMWETGKSHCQSHRKTS